MGILNKIFGKKEEPTPSKQSEAPKVIIKETRHIVEGIKGHMKEIMELVEKNEDFKLSKKDILDEGKEEEKIFEYEMYKKAKLARKDEGTIEVIIDNVHIGTIKKGSTARINKLIQNGTIRDIHAEVTGGNYKILKYLATQDKYELDEPESEFSITIEISYTE